MHNSPSQAAAAPRATHYYNSIMDYIAHLFPFIKRTSIADWLEQRLLSPAHTHRLLLSDSFSTQIGFV